MIGVFCVCFVFYLLLGPGSSGSVSLAGIRHLLLASLEPREAVLVGQVFTPWWQFWKLSSIWGDHRDMAWIGAYVLPQSCSVWPNSLLGLQRGGNGTISSAIRRFLLLVSLLCQPRKTGCNPSTDVWETQPSHCCQGHDESVSYLVPVD